MKKKKEPESLRCIIAGSRNITDYNLVDKAIRSSGFSDKIIEVVSGKAKGADKLGEDWANAHNIPVKSFPAKWSDLSHKDAIIRENSFGKYDAKAGIRRNEEMGKYADALIAIIKDDSSGTTHMIEYMRGLGKLTYVWEV
jgi:hypothetical protein